jgi:hypothetical protein
LTVVTAVSELFDGVGSLSAPVTVAVFVTFAGPGGAVPVIVIVRSAPGCSFVPGQSTRLPVTVQPGVSVDTSVTPAGTSSVTA